MFIVWFAVFALLTRECSLQEQDGPYRGKFIGAFNTYHHQVSGDVYAVDDWTLLLVNFNYDGTGDDTFFWAGDAVRPGPQGFIVPDQHGKTNILERYINQEVRLRLPDGKRVSRLKWVCVYDLDAQACFGDVHVPDEFAPPAPRALPALAGPAVASKPLQILTANTILIPEFTYDGSGGEVYFWTGVGPQPSPKGMKIPDEDGYLEPLRAYRGDDVRLQLAGGVTVFDVTWLAVYDVTARAALASVLLPEGLNVPPAAADLHPYQSKLPQCKQLHRDYQVSWEVFGPQVTFELAGQIGLDEYMAWGVSGSLSRSRMVGADVALAQYSHELGQGFVHDYNISDKAPCVVVLDRRRGVCRDTALGGVDSYQLLTSQRDRGLSVITFRRTLKPDEPMDLPWAEAGAQFAVWAVGRLDAAREPGLHRLYPRADTALRLDQRAADNDCFRFTMGSRPVVAPWETAQLFDPALRVFRFTLGAAGGARGVRGRAGGAGGDAPLAWYVNGQLAPDLQLRRGLQYSFEVLGGNNPHSATHYHPLVVTAEPVGGLERLDAGAQRAIRVLAGVHYTRRDRLTPTHAGPLCVGERAEAGDARRDAAFSSFRAFNRSLHWACARGEPARLALTPNSSWPDLVYYHSFTHSGMGGRIFIVDRHKRNLGRKGADSGATVVLSLAPALCVALAVAAVSLARRH